jgi:hypothetical protein
VDLFISNVGPPRPYLHPIRTLAGTVITDAEPEDHPWHLGLSLAVQDVNGVNFWGGRTYVRDQGYVWLDNHGTITGNGDKLVWRDPLGQPLMTERRRVKSSIVDDRTWRLDFAWELTALAVPVVFGSPTTNGRELGAGYGGCFLRLAPRPSAEVFAGPLSGEDQVNGCTEPTVTWRAKDFEDSVSGAQRWFVRSAMYPGLCDAWAYDRVRTIAAGRTWSSAIALVIRDR